MAETTENQGPKLDSAEHHIYATMQMVDSWGNIELTAVQRKELNRYLNLIARTAVDDFQKHIGTLARGLKYGL